MLHSAFSEELTNSIYLLIIQIDEILRNISNWKCWNEEELGFANLWRENENEILTHWGRDKMAAISQATLSKHIFLNENVTISIKISLKFIPKGPFNNNPALVQIMAWRRSGDKPLFEPIMVSLLTHICIDLARNDNSGCANEILGCAKCHFWWKSPWKWKNCGDFRVCN